MLTRLFLLALVLGLGAVAAKLYVFDFVRVEGNDMAPAVLDGDLVLVNRRHGRLARGDVVLLRHPREPDRLLVRRVVALPGDEVAVQGGAVVLAGRAARHERAGEIVLRRAGADGARPFAVAIERLGERPVRTLHRAGRRSRGAAPQELRDGLFVLGDNRGEAIDSRDFGPVLPSFVRGTVLAILEASEHASPSLDPTQRRWTRVR